MTNTQPPAFFDSDVQEVGKAHAGIVRRSTAGLNGTFDVLRQTCQEVEGT
jgi:hypothetical protein